MNSIKLTEKLHVLNAELFLSQRPLLQCDPLKRERPATAWPKPQGRWRVSPAPSSGPCTARGSLWNPVPGGPQPRPLYSQGVFVESCSRRSPAQAPVQPGGLCGITVPGTCRVCF